MRFKSFLLTAIFSLAILIMPAAAQAEVSVFVDQQQVQFDQQPIIDQQLNTTLVPFRQVFEALGGEVWYDGNDHSANGQMAGVNIKLPIGDHQATINDSTIPLNIATQIINGRTIVPLSLFSENIGCEVITENEADKQVIYINTKHKIIIGTDFTFPPFEFVDSETGEYIGFDIDLINAIAQTANLDIEIKNISFATLIPSLHKNEIDAVISGLSISEPRKEVVGFTAPYFETGLCIVVPSKDNSTHSVKDLAEKSIAFLGHSYEQSMLDEIVTADVKTVDTVDEAIDELKNGRVDALVADYLWVIDQVAHNDDLKIVGEKLAIEEFGIATHLDNQQLLQKLNAGLATIKASGEYAEIYKKWFGAEPPAIE